jgi:hypothetical protein
MDSREVVESKTLKALQLKLLSDGGRELPGLVANQVSQPLYQFDLLDSPIEPTSLTGN